MKKKQVEPDDEHFDQVDLVAEFEREHTPRAGRTLVVGSRVYPGRRDRRALYPACIGVDMLEGDGVDIVANLETTDLGPFDHIDCCSVLEHTPRPWVLAANLQSMLVPGGTLLLSVPFIWRPHAYPNDYWRFTREALPLLFPGIEWAAREYCNWRRQSEGKLPGLKVDGHPHYARTELLAFGVKA